MRILLCCEFYYPSIGGVQVVMQHLAERFVKRGHQVTIATTNLPDRILSELNGVHIEEFSVSGNGVSGISGEVQAYREYVLSEHFDIVMIKAAQQWTFDALWPVFDLLSAVKIFIPCGFSSLYEPSYANYFKKLPEILKKIDQLIFYASDYRDINFARDHGIDQLTIIPNGACEAEFSVPTDQSFRTKLGIEPSDFIFLTVGSFTGQKGHLEVVKAFALADMNGQPATLILNGNKCINFDRSLKGLLVKTWGVAKTYGIKYVVKHTVKISLRYLGIKIGKEDELESIVQAINGEENKKVLVVDLPRPSLIQAFMAANLFVFASNIEYSPLVLFESAAAGTPFLTVPVGNSEEIACWTEAGVVCPAPKDTKGYTRVDPLKLSSVMSELVRDPERLKRMAAAGRKNWLDKFTWGKISVAYETIFKNILEQKAKSK